MNNFINSKLKSIKYSKEHLEIINFKTMYILEEIGFFLAVVRINLSNNKKHSSF